MSNSSSLFAKHRLTLNTSSNGVVIESQDSLHVTMVKLLEVISEYLESLDAHPASSIDAHPASSIAKPIIAPVKVASKVVVKPTIVPKVVVPKIVVKPRVVALPVIAPVTNPIVKKPKDKVQNTERPRGDYSLYVQAHPRAWPLIVRPKAKFPIKQQYEVSLKKVLADLEEYPAITPSLVLTLAKRIDKEYLNKRLSNVLKFTTRPEKGLCLVFGIDNSIDRALGYFQNAGDGEPSSIAVSTKNLEQITPETICYVRNNRECPIENRRDALVVTLCHEMVHALIWASDDYETEEQRAVWVEDGLDHGEFFQEVMTKLFGYCSTSGNYTPQATRMRPNGIIANRERVEVGDDVLYLVGSRSVVGKVKSKNRYTMLVEGTDAQVHEIEYHRASLAPK